MFPFSDSARIFETNHHTFSHIPVNVPTGRVAERWKMASTANAKNTVEVGVGNGFLPDSGRARAATTSMA
jgi:hypothetical protein